MYCVPTIHLGIVRSFLPRWGYISTGAVQGENEGREPFDSRPSAVHFRVLRGSGAVGMAAMASARAGVASLPHFTVPSARMRPAHFAAGSPHLPDAMPTVSLFSGFALSESGRVYESVHSTPSASTTTFGNLTACAAARNASTSGASVSDGTGFASSLMRRSIHSDCFGVGLPFASAPKRLAANSAFCGLLPMICARADIFCCLSILAYPFCPVGATPQRERGRGKTIRLPSSPNEEGEPLSAPLRGRFRRFRRGRFQGSGIPRPCRRTTGDPCRRGSAPPPPPCGRGSSTSDRPCRSHAPPPPPCPPCTRNPRRAASSCCSVLSAPLGLTQRERGRGKTRRLLGRALHTREFAPAFASCLAGITRLLAPSLGADATTRSDLVPASLPRDLASDVYD